MNHKEQIFWIRWFDDKWKLNRSSTSMLWEAVELAQKRQREKDAEIVDSIKNKDIYLAGYQEACSQIKEAIEGQDANT